MGLDVGFDVVGLGVGFDVVGLDVCFDVLGLDVVGLDVVGLISLFVGGTSSMTFWRPIGVKILCIPTMNLNGPYIEIRLGSVGI